MISQKRIFDGGMNADDSLRLLSDREYIQLMNGRIGKSRTGKDYRVENVPGTLQLVSGVLPAGTNMTIGSAVDEGRNRVIYFNYNSNGNHGIYAYDLLTSTSYIVLLNSQVTGGLGFGLTSRIDRNARVVGDLLYFTDNVNEPRCLNIEKGIKLNQSGYATTYTAYASPLLYTDLTLIKRPPVYSLVATKVTDLSFSNNLTKDYSFQFCYRYNYKDNQVSALSEFSNFIPANYATDTFNAVDISMPLTETIDDDIQSIDFVVRFGNAGNSFIIKSLNKNITTDAASITAHNAGTAYTYRFYNNKSGIALDSITANTSYDYVPITTKTLEVARNRIFLANNKVGYDTPTTTSLGLNYTNTAISSPYVQVASIYSNGWTDPQNVEFNGTPITLHMNITGGNIFATDYTIRGTAEHGCSIDNNPTTFPTAADTTDSIFLNLSTTKTFSFSVQFQVDFYNDTGDTPISIYVYLVSSGQKILQKINTFNLKKGVRYTNQAVNIQASVPPLTNLFIVAYPDPVALHNNIKVNTGQISIADVTTISYPTPFFKTGGSYMGGVVFFDRFKRKCGVVTNDTATITIPKRIYTSSPSNTVSFSLSNTNALSEIPSWAYYYQVVLTKNLNNNSYIQGAVSDMRYGTKDFTTGLFTYEDLAYSGNHACVAINIKGLIDAGLGYTYNAGDQIFLFNNLSAATYTLRVTGTDGYWVQAELKNLGTFGAAQSPFATGQTYLWGCEIYNPISSSITYNYYGASPVYKVNNPTTGIRTYNTLSANLQGDTYLLPRQGAMFMFASEGMNPLDYNWKVWDTNIGWLNLIDTIGQKQKTSNIQFSDTFIQGTKVNGLNKFQTLNTTDIGSDSGGIQKLQLTNKQGQQIGTVMLIVAANDTLSMYLGETQITSSAKDAFIAQSTGVIGSINSLKNNFGTMNPESVYAYMGSVYFIDIQNGVMVQYSDNGNFAVSSYKMASFFTKYASDYLALGSSAITALNGFSHIPTIFDPFHKELFVTLPALTSTVNQLPSYSGVTPTYASSINNRFDAYDKLGKTITLNTDKNKWIGVFEYLPEWSELVNTDVLLFKNGVLYKKEADFTNYNTFFGVQQPTRLVFTPNSNPSEIKDVFNIAVEGQIAPDYTVVYADYPNQQITDLVSTDYVDKEGVKYAAVLRDRLSPNVSGTAFEKSLYGDFIKDVAPKIMLEWQKYNGLLSVDFVDVGTSSSKGHSGILKQ